jgi:hypothetical protein
MPRAAVSDDGRWSSRRTARRPVRCGEPVFVCADEAYRMRPGNSDRGARDLLEYRWRCQACKRALGRLFFLPRCIKIDLDGLVCMPRAHRDCHDALVAVEDRHEAIGHCRPHQDREKHHKTGELPHSEACTARGAGFRGYAARSFHAWGELNVVSQAVAANTPAKRPSSTPML